jgi:hypothetical protein
MIMQHAHYSTTTYPLALYHISKRLLSWVQTPNYENHAKIPDCSYHLRAMMYDVFTKKKQDFHKDILIAMRLVNMYSIVGRGKNAVQSVHACTETNQHVLVYLPFEIKEACRRVQPINQPVTFCTRKISWRTPACIKAHSDNQDKHVVHCTEAHRLWSDHTPPMRHTIPMASMNVAFLAA